jgi:chromosomal replication initiation ATPase DnaA
LVPGFIRFYARLRNVAKFGARPYSPPLAWNLTGLSFQAIGAAFGGRDPATVRHACEAAAVRLAADPAVAALAHQCQRGVGSGAPEL